MQPILDAIAGVQKANPAFRVEEFGPASANHVLSDTLAKDFQRAEVLSVPVTLIILVLAFGALVAAGIPVLLAFSAVLAAIGLNQIFSHVLPAADTTRTVILLVGMAVGVDYSLFYLRREREERAAGLAPHSALLRAASTSGQAVLISGLTVLIAMAGMFFAGTAIFSSIGLGTMIVVFVAMVGSLTVLPALLHKLGDRVEVGKIPFTRGRRKSTRGVAFLERDLAAGAPSSAAGNGAQRWRVARVRDSGARFAHEAAELHRPAAQLANRPHLRARPAGVPGLPDAGRGRGPRRQRDHEGVQHRVCGV